MRNMPEIAERPPLTKKQVEFLHLYTASPFMPFKEMCRLINTSPNQLKIWKETSPEFQDALQVEFRRSQQVANMSRKTVMRGLLEAIDMAKDQRQPAGVISGWKEIGRMCGFYEPERREVVLSMDSVKLVEEMKGLTKERLIALVNDDEVIEGEVVYESQ